MITWLTQTASVTKFGLLTIPRRLGSVGAAVFGIAGVVGVLVSVPSIARGFQRTMSASGSADAVMVLRSGANNEMVSGLTREDARTIADAPGVARSSDGPLASSELFVVINLYRKGTTNDSNVPLRGVEQAAIKVRDNLKIVKGRMIEWGKNEVIAGAGAAEAFSGLDVGDSIPVGPSKWQVVGIFTAGGGIAESEIWTDAGVLQPAYKRGDSFQSVSIKLSSSGAFEQFTNSVLKDPRLNVKVVRQTEYYAEQSTSVTNLVNNLGYGIAILMALGAVFGALNTMYNAVSARTREIATLRALGFGTSPVIASILLESLMLSLIGGAIGGSIAYFAFNGFRTSTLNFQTFSQVTFAFDVTPGLLIMGIIWAALIGLVGGLLPAIRAASLPIASGLRAM